MAGNRIKRRRKGLGRGQVATWSNTPREYMDQIARSGMIFTPEVQHPRFGLAILKHLVEGGGLGGADDLGDVGGKLPGAHFGDGFNWSQYRQMWRYFRFDDVSTQLVKSSIAAMFTLASTARAVGGPEHAWRLWNSLFEEMFGDVNVDISPNEPVASLRVLVGDDVEDGWDAWFPNYHLYTLKTLERAVDRGLADRQLMRAALSPQGSQLRQTIAGVVHLIYERGGDSSARAAHGDMFADGTILRDILRENPQVFDALEAGPMMTNPTAALMMGDASVIASGSASTWSAQLRTLLAQEPGKPGYYPVSSGTHEALTRLDPSQRYGAVRQHKDGTNSKHSGLDLPGAGGIDDARAVYAGRIIALRGDYDAKEAKAQTPGWSAGNHVIVETPCGGAMVRIGYYHLDSVAAGLKLGASVSKGQALGKIGETGNAKGPHLHLDAKWSLPSHHTGRSSASWALDPEIVLTRGAVEAARVAGADLLVSGKPHLGGAIFALQTVASPDFMLPSGAQYADFGQGGLLDYVNNLSRKLSDKMVNSLNDGIVGKVLETGFSLVGLDGKVYDVYKDVINKGWEAAKKSGGDPVATFKAALSAKGLPQAAIEVAVSAASSGVLDAPKVGDPYGDGADPSHDHSEPGEQ